MIKTGTILMGRTYPKKDGKEQPLELVRYRLYVDEKTGEVIAQKEA